METSKSRDNLVKNGENVKRGGIKNADLEYIKVIDALSMVWTVCGAEAGI